MSIRDIVMLDCEHIQPHTKRATLALHIASSETGKILDIIRVHRQISLPKLAVKAKMITEDLDSILESLSAEGALEVRLDEIGFSHIVLVKEGGTRLWIS